MAEMTLTRMRLAEGIWEGLLSSSREAPPSLLLRHLDEVVGTPETEAADASPEGEQRWFVRFRIPVERLADGVQTFVIEDTGTGTALAEETIIAGDVLDEDVRAEVALLRAELDMLKRAFRRHCSET
ncbi:MAG: hypothetical protein OXQ92_12905 [Boseongicola sp.]|nr:hypothetical protein [Boseongicola sp.]MDD9976594.1 hypothetical protein [Boseongicola sp.]